MRHDLLLTGGHVIDPASGVDGRRDVAFASGRVAAVDTTIAPASAREVGDVSGAYVSPGLIDLHAHAFIAGHDLGIETDPVCASTGVTTLCDAGSTGAANFAGLREYVMARAETRVLGFLHIAVIGLSHLGIGEHCYLAIGRSGELGSLAAGAAGDAAVFSVEEGQFPYQDADGNTIEGPKRWTPRLTVRAGRVSWRRWPSPGRD
jgi:predicted amidohydrolase